MLIEIHARPFSVTDAMQRHIYRQLNTALQRGAQRIRRVSVQLSDINGPRGGADKQCQIDIDLVAGRTLHISDTQADLYQAVTRAARRLAHNLSRSTGKWLNRKHLRARKRTDVDVLEG